MTRSEAKALFNTGEIITEAKMHALIDAIFDHDQENADDIAAVAADADTAVEVAEGLAAKVFGVIRYNHPNYVTDNIEGASTVHSATKGSTVTVTFDEAMPDTKYTIVIGGSLVAPGFTKNVGSVVFTFTTLVDVGDDEDEFSFAIYR